MGNETDRNAIANESELSSTNNGGVQQELEEEKKKETEKTNTIPFYRLFSFADSFDILLMVVGTICAMANGVSLPLLTVFFGELTDSFGLNQNDPKLRAAVSSVDNLYFARMSVLNLLYLAIGAGVVAFLQVACWMVTGERQASRIRALYLTTILRQDITFFDMETTTGEVMSRLSEDTVLIQDAMGEKVGKFIQLTSTFFAGFIIAFIRGWLLTLVMLSTIPPVIFVGAIASIVISKMSSRGQTTYAKAADIVEQTISSIRTVASFTGEKRAVAKYKTLLVEVYKSRVNEGLAAGFGFGLAMFVIICGYSLATWFGAKLIITKGYTGGEVLNVVIAVLTGSISLGQASPSLSAFAAGQAAAFKMFETIKRKPAIDASHSEGKVLEDVNGDIDLKDVYFSYPTRPDELIINGFSLHIPRGVIAALVGESGSGKSTVISLLERFYDPQSGEVLIDGINLKEFQLKWIRSKIGLVSQEPVLFASTIRENIAYGKDGATNEEIRVATEIANASKFIDKLPQGLDTMVGDHGTQMSGGQKQRIAIARAILKDPRILLLDEATSALDAESEQVVQEALDRIMVNRTTIIVAHRLSTVRNVDTIAVIHKGRMVEMGLHTELLKDPGGAYRQLIRLQEAKKHAQEATADQNKHEITSESFRQSSKRVSRSISPGNSSRHSFSVSLEFPTGQVVSEDVAPTKEETPVSLQKLPNVSLRRLAYLNKPEIIVLLAGTIAASVNGVVLPIFGLLFSNVVETFYKPHDELRKDANLWALVFLLLAVASFIAIPAKSYFFAVAGSKLIQRIRLICFAKVVNMEVSWFDQEKNTSGMIGARLSANAAMVRALVGDALGQLVENIAAITAALIIAFTASWQLALIVLVMFPLLGLNGYVQMEFLKGFSADSKMMYEKASQVANDAVGSIRTVASFCAEEKVMRLYKKKCEGPVQTGIMQGLVSGFGFGLSLFLMYTVYAASFYAGARLVQDGKASFSDVFRVFFALTTAAVAVFQSRSMAPDSAKAKDAAASIFAMIDRKSVIDPSNESGETLNQVKGDIELRHVNFKYPSRPEVQIFRDLSLAIHSGKTVALVGESGSGKSTVISLLQRFYDPDSGQITLDGIEIQKFQLKWLRHQMGLVSQEPVLFNDTIRANIAYGKDGDATETEIMAASELANAHKFISSLQQGYDAMVGERGAQLSGGQKQRVAIARAIIKSPKILLLDEATSALDAESERVVQDALDKVMVDRTTIIVAHRLSTIKNADVIAVVKNGVIVEKGKHENLIKIKDGFYASSIALNTSASTP